MMPPSRTAPACWQRELQRSRANSDAAIWSQFMVRNGERGFGQGLIEYTAGECRAILGLREDQQAAKLGYAPRAAVIHRDPWCEHDDRADRSHRLRRAGSARSPAAWRDPARADPPRTTRTRRRAMGHRYTRRRRRSRAAVRWRPGGDPCRRAYQQPRPGRFPRGQCRRHATADRRRETKRRRSSSSPRCRYASRLSQYGALEGGGGAPGRKQRPRLDGVRPPGVYGPRDIDYFEMFRSARSALVPLPRRGASSIIHVDDLALACY